MTEALLQIISSHKSLLTSLKIKLKSSLLGQKQLLTLEHALLLFGKIVRKGKAGDRVLRLIDWLEDYEEKDSDYFQTQLLNQIGFNPELLQHLTKQSPVSFHPNL